MKRVDPVRNNTQFDYMSFANAVFDEMVREYIGQNEVARRVGVCKATMSRLMHYQPLDIVTILRVCDYLARPITDFIII